MTNNLAKWTPDQDQLLREGVQKFGIKWQLVKGYMSNVRSINSIIKRWHGKVKYQKDMKTIRESTGRFSKILPEMPTFKNKRQSDIEGELSDEKGISWKKNWSERDDKKLKLLVVQSSIMNWSLLADALETDQQQVKLRWKKIVYPCMIRLSSKVGGSLKWSLEQDKILNVGFKQDVDWEISGRHFLPQRSLGSIQARWRRVAKLFQVKAIIQNKYQARKDCLKRIAKLRRLQSEMQRQNQEQQKDNNQEY